MKEQKKELRRLIRQRKTLYCASTLKTLSDEILERLENNPMFQSAQTVLLYFSMNDEVHTHAFIEKWSGLKTILLPVVTGDLLELRVYTGNNGMATNLYGIPEPQGEAFTDYKQIDLAIIPGVAFDRNGNRLGRGKGYYDRLLPLIKAPKIGICFPFQLIEEIPTEAFDISMNIVFF